MDEQDRWQFSGPLTIDSPEDGAGLEIDKKERNAVALVLKSKGAGWGSGVQFLNKAAQGGKNYGIYSGFGSLHFADVENNIDRMTITASGNIGIGTATPSAGLEINKQNTNEVALLLNSSGDGWGSGIQFKNTSSRARPYGIYAGKDGRLHFCDENKETDCLMIDPNGWLTVNPFGSAGIKVRHLEGKHFQNDGDDALYLNWFSGKDVHIGDQSRQSKLWVSGDLSIGSGKQITSPGRLHIAGDEKLYLLNKSGVVISKAWQGSGSLTVEGNLGVEGVFMTLKTIDDNEARQTLESPSLPNGTAIMGVETTNQGTALVWYWKDGRGGKHKAWNQGSAL